MLNNKSIIIRIFITSIFFSLIVAGCDSGTTKSVPDIKVPETKGCGTDFNCFIGAAASCDSNQVTYSDIVIGPQDKTTSTYSMSLTRDNSGSCILSVTLESVSAEFSEDYIVATAAKQGITTEEARTSINGQISKYNAENKGKRTVRQYSDLSVLSQELRKVSEVNIKELGKSPNVQCNDFPA